MKKIFIVTILLFNYIVYSQDVYEIVGKDTCECLSNKKLDFSKLPKETLETELGFCMLQSYSKSSDKFKGKDKINLDNEEGMSKLGEKVAMKMLVSCPDVILQLGRDELENRKVVDNILVNLKIEGQFIEFVKNDFLSISVKDNSGRTHSLLMLYFFENSNLITENLLKKDDKITIEFIEEEFYDSKAKDFRYFKVLKGIKKL
ncbi:hypothetical protein [Flavobacterium sp.]|uniref:hypothetical protein n=1 Tax=Flavobacterium sp. TaxID=239 RepID=UPI003753A052